MLRSHVCKKIQSVTRFAGFTLKWLGVCSSSGIIISLKKLPTFVRRQRHHHLPKKTAHVCTQAAASSPKKKTPEGVGVGWVLGGSRGIGSVGLQRHLGGTRGSVSLIQQNCSVMVLMVLLLG